MKDCFQVKGDGKGGGLALYWTDDITVDLLSFSDHHIDVHISGGPYDHMWRATFVYGEPKACDRHLMWTKLRQIRDRSDKPWLMLGDFNEAMWQEEHFSSTARSERLMMDFRKFFHTVISMILASWALLGPLIISSGVNAMLRSAWIELLLHRHGLRFFQIIGFVTSFPLDRITVLYSYQLSGV
jgi:hypothetical protein